MTVDLTSLIENPQISGLIVLLLSMLFPAPRVSAVLNAVQGYFEKFPVLGSVLRILRLYIERVNAAQELEKVLGAGDLAQVLVGGAEQMKAMGKLDGASAAAQITQRLETTYGLDPDTARKVTERAVLDLKLYGQEIKVPKVHAQPSTTEQATEVDRSTRR